MTVVVFTAEVFDDNAKAAEATLLEGRRNFFPGFGAYDGIHIKRLADLDGNFKMVVNR